MLPVAASWVGQFSVGREFVRVTKYETVTAVGASKSHRFTYCKNSSLILRAPVSQTGFFRKKVTNILGKLTGVDQEGDYIDDDLDMI